MNMENKEKYMESSHMNSWTIILLFDLFRNSLLHDAAECIYVMEE